MPSNAGHGGEAILEAFRRLGIDYIMSSPGSEWSPLWEALASQETSGLPGPTYLESWHEMVCVDMAMGYALMTGRPQACVLHAGVGLLHGIMGVRTAYITEVPMIVMSGEAATVGADPDIEVEQQWYGGLSIGGADRLIQPMVKSARMITNPNLLFESVIRAGEMAARMPMGPVHLHVPIEHMLQPWTPPADRQPVPPVPRLSPAAADVETVADRIAASDNPVIVAENAGRDPRAFDALVAFAEALAIPVVNSRSAHFANFPSDHPLSLGAGYEPLRDADLVLLLDGRTPWYPPARRPTAAPIVAIGNNPLKTALLFQTLFADEYLEGDTAIALALLGEAVARRGSDAGRIAARRDRVAAMGAADQASRQAAETKAEADASPNAIALCRALSDEMPDDTIYIDETISHAGLVKRNLKLTHPQSFFRSTGGLGQGLGLALGIKLAAPERPVVLTIGDGSFLYNPIVQGLGAAHRHRLPILIVIFDNTGYETMRLGHVRYFPGGAADTSQHFVAGDIEAPAFERLGESYGFKGWHVQAADQLRPAIREALAELSAGRTAILRVALPKPALRPA